MMKKISGLIATLAVAAGLAIATAPAASAAPCGGTYSLGVGGVGGGDSRYIQAQQPVQYSAFPFAASIDEGVRELNRLYNAQRALCPGQHVKVVGHSNGAAVVSTWFSQAFRPNTNGVLLGNPKRPGTGISQITGLPNGGTNANYRGAPVLDVCQRRDPICNFPAGPAGYFDGTHQRYQPAPAWGDTGNGMIWIG